MCLYYSDRTAEEWTGNRGERGNDMQQRAAGGIKPMAAAGRTKPLYTPRGRLLYQLSHWVPPRLNYFLRTCYIACVFQAGQSRKKKNKTFMFCKVCFIAFKDRQD